MAVGDLQYEILVNDDESIAVDYGHLESDLIENGFSVKPSLKEWDRENGKVEIYGISSGKVVGYIRRFNGRKNSILIVKNPSDSSDEYADRLKLNKCAKNYEPVPSKVRSGKEIISL